MKTDTHLRLDADLRRRLDKAAAARGLSLAEVIRTACEAYLTGMDSYWPALVDRAVEGAASATAPLAAELAEIRRQNAANLLLIRIDIETISKNVAKALARMEDIVGEGNEDTQVAMAMIYRLAKMVFTALPQVGDQVNAEVLGNQRHSQWLDQVRDDMVATKRRPSATIHLLHPVPDDSVADDAPVTADDRMSINSVKVRGFLDKPVALRVLDKTGDRVANYRLLTDGTDIHQIAAYGRDALFAAQNFAVGDLIYVEGEIKTRSFTTEQDKKTGRKHTVRELVPTKQQLIERAPASPAVPLTDLAAKGHA